MSFLRSVEHQLEQGNPRAACLLFGAIYEGRWTCFGCKATNTVWQAAGPTLSSTCRACAAPAHAHGPDALEQLAVDLRDAIDSVLRCIHRTTV